MLSGSGVSLSMGGVLEGTWLLVLLMSGVIPLLLNS